MKKFLIAFFAVLALTVSVSILAKPALAASGDVLYKSDKIYDFNELQNRAEKGITDSHELDEKTEESSSAIITDLESNETENLSENIESTTQKIQTAEDENGNLVTTYATTSFFDPSSMNTPDKKGPQRASDSDSGVKSGATFSSTIYYNTYTKNGAKHYDMYKVSGNYKLRSAFYAVTEREINIGQSGPSYMGSKSHVNQGITRYPGYSYSISTPSSWQPVYKTSDWAAVGITMRGNITGDGKNIYRYVFQNSIFD